MCLRYRIQDSYPFVSTIAEGEGYQRHRGSGMQGNREADGRGQGGRDGGERWVGELKWR